MDCLKRFRRQKPMLVGKLAVVCMQIALGGQSKHCSSPKNVLILSLKMATFSAFWALAHVRGEGGKAPPGPPWIRQWS